MRCDLVEVTVVFIATLIISTAAGDEQATKADMARLQGEWTMVSGEIQGEAMPEGLRTTARRVAKENETAVMVGGQLFMKAKFTLDPTKTPKTIDYEMTGGPTEGKKQLGIYEIDGEEV